MEEEAIVLTPPLLAAFGRWLLNDIGVDLAEDYGCPTGDQPAWLERMAERYYTEVAGEAGRWKSYATAWSGGVHGNGTSASVPGRGLRIVGHDA